MILFLIEVFTPFLYKETRETLNHEDSTFLPFSSQIWYIIIHIYKTYHNLVYYSAFAFIITEIRCTGPNFFLLV